MPNKNRQRGDYFERRAREALEADGWLVIRSAGSLGPADLVALKTNHFPRLVACKVNGRMSRHEIHALNDAAEQAGARPIVAWWVRPGWVGLAVITRHEKTALSQLHMPPRRRKPTVGKYPADPAQMTIYDALEGSE